MLLLFTFLFYFTIRSGAHDRNCPSQELLQKQLKNNPELLKSRQELENATQILNDKYLMKGNKEASSSQRTGVITIPVVFHIIHNGEAVGNGRNISDAQILSQLQVLNEDFRKLNANSANTPIPFKPFSADCEIEFCLALQDPQGLPAIGIQRFNGMQESFDINQMENLKTMLAWDPNRYLNIYSADITAIGGAIGFATFPVLPVPLNDGVVCDFRTIGRAPANPFATFFGGAFRGGRTATHEIGHWLNVFHIWGDDGNLCNGTDLVFDTPNQGGPNFGCPLFPKFSCNNLPNGDMFMNYMDLSDDACMNMFTQGQKLRMSATLDNVRTGFVNNTLCARLFLSTNITAATATLSWSPFVGAVSHNVRWRILGGNGVWTNGVSITNSININGLMPFPAAYEWQVQPVFANNTTGAFSVSQLFRTLAALPPVVCPNDPNENAIFGPYLMNGTQGQGIICPAADIDRFVIQNNMPNGTLRLVLTNLALDYDIELRNTVNNTLLAASTNTGIANDTLLYTNLPTGNYYVYVFAKIPLIVNVQPYTVKMLLLPNGMPIPPGMKSVKPVNNAVKIFPNPANHYISVDAGSYNGSLTITLYDLWGNVHHQKNIPEHGGENLNLDSGHIPSGIYILQIKKEDETINEKVIVSH